MEVLVIDEILNLVIGLNNLRFKSFPRVCKMLVLLMMTEKLCGEFCMILAFNVVTFTIRKAIIYHLMHKLELAL